MSDEDFNPEDIPLEYEIDPTINVAKLGIEAEVFFRSALGLYLIDKAKHEVDQGMRLLVDVDPEDKKQNREVRNRINAPKMALSWIKDAVRKGELARGQLEDEDFEQ